jgi:glutamate/tyrosine decarboxylase-like PLP-dependent enzyme
VAELRQNHIRKEQEILSATQLPFPIDEHAMPPAYAALTAAYAHAAAFLGSLDTREVAARAGATALRQMLGGDLPEGPADPAAVIDAVVRGMEPGLLGTSTGRFFGWVIGGALPVGIAADWLASSWDQNAAAFATSPASSVVEEVCGAWLKELLGIPSEASFAFVTGCQMAHATALAAARHRLLAERGIDVESDGLAGAPPLRILTGQTRHESLLRAARLVGIGTRAVAVLPVDAQSRLQLGALAEALAASDQPTVVCLQAGDMNTGAFDPFAEACALARAHGAWVHVDGAFGLWAAASPRLRHLLAGAEGAQSWATDGHKWLNVPQDCGYVFIADRDAHRGAFAQTTSFAHAVEDTRRQLEWGPDWSRRTRALPSYAVIRSLGRAGIAAMIDGCCDHARALTQGLSELPGVEVLAWPQINQALVRFLDAEGQHDARTEAVVARIQDGGITWFGSTTWHGMRAMRISVCDWRTDAGDVARAIEAVRLACI